MNTAHIQVRLHTITMQNSALTPPASQNTSILRTKRTRIGEASVIQPKTMSDRDQMLATFESGCLSLHEAARDSEQIVRFRTNFVKNLIKLQQQIQRNSRLHDDDFIPKNIDLKIAITGTPNIQNTDEFKTIQGKASTALLHYQTAMKGLMIETAKLEINMTKELLQETVFNFTKELFSDRLLLQGVAEDSDDDNNMDVLAEVLTELILDDDSFSKIQFGRVKSSEREDNGTRDKIQRMTTQINRYQSSVNTKVKEQMTQTLLATVEMQQALVLSQSKYDAIAKRRAKTQASTDINDIQMKVDNAMAQMDEETLNELVDRRIKENEKSKNSKRGAKSTNKKSSASSTKKKTKTRKEQKRNGQGNKGKDSKRDNGKKKSKKSQNTGRN